MPPTFAPVSVHLQGLAVVVNAVFPCRCRKGVAVLSCCTKVVKVRSVCSGVPASQRIVNTSNSPEMDDGNRVPTLSAYAKNSSSRVRVHAGPCGRLGFKKST